MDTNQRRSGFTVIELMIVVAVIALLAVALLPNLTGARTSANITAVHAVLTRAAVAAREGQSGLDGVLARYPARKLA